MNEVGLSPELFAQIRQIQIRTQRLVTDLVAGQYESAFRGRGMEFQEVREYRPGDDIRRIDWNVTAKTGAPFVKEHREERELTVMLLVDRSSSLDFGASARRKQEVAAEVAAVLAYSAIKSNDKVGLLIFTDTVEHYVPPKKGRAHLWRLVRDVLTFQPRGRRTSIGAALAHLSQVQHRRVVAFLLSDFFDTGFDDALLVCKKRHDLTAIAVTDAREQALPACGIVELEDLETGQRVIVDLAEAATRQRFATAAAAQRSEVLERLRRAGVDTIDVPTEGSSVDPIVRYFRSRGR